MMVADSNYKAQMEIELLVLILIVMDDGRRPNVSKNMKPKWYSLNPYCNG